MPLEHEKMILTTLVVCPDLLQLFWDRGLGENFFKGSESILVYRLICDLAKDNKVSWENLEHFGFGKISPTFTGDLQRKTFISTVKFSKTHLTMLIDELEEYRNDGMIQDIIGSKDRLTKTDKDLIVELASKRKPGREAEENTMKSALKEYSGWKDIDKTNITTGFPKIDKYIGDLSWGEVMAIMGRTTTGKTFVGINILNHLVCNNVKDIGFFSLEMSKSALSERIIQVYQNKDRLNVNQLDIDTTGKRFEDVKLYSKMYSVFEIGEIVKRDKLRIVFIDFLQQVKGQGNSLYEKATNVIQDIKALAKEQNIIVIVMVQLSRKAGHGAEEVRLDMARDSGAIEENADFILGIWNPEKKGKVAGEVWKKDVRSLRLIKNKRGATIGIYISFDPDTGKMLEQ